MSQRQPKSSGVTARNRKAHARVARARQEAAELEARRRRERSQREFDRVFLREPYKVEFYGWTSGRVRHTVTGTWDEVYAAVEEQVPRFVTIRCFSDRYEIHNGMMGEQNLMARIYRGRLVRRSAAARAA